MRRLIAILLFITLPVIAEDSTPPPPDINEQPQTEQPIPNVNEAPLNRAAGENKTSKQPVKPAGKTDVLTHKRGNQEIEEQRIKGRVSTVKVTPKHSKPYFIYYNENWNETAGNQDLEDTNKRPHWKVLSW